VSAGQHDTRLVGWLRGRSTAIALFQSGVVFSTPAEMPVVRSSHTVCGILMHSSLALTREGLPLGLAAVRFWTRKKFKGIAALKRKINPTRVPIEQKESSRCRITCGNPPH